MIGLIGSVGRVGLFGRAPRPVAAPAPDFTLSGTTATTAWNSAAAFGNLTPNAETPAGAYFVLVGEPAGLAVVNG